MSIPFILIATACYVLTSISCLRQRDYPMALVWASYSLRDSEGDDFELDILVRA